MEQQCNIYIYEFVDNFIQKNLCSRHRRCIYWVPWKPQLQFASTCIKQESALLFEFKPNTNSS